MPGWRWGEIFFSFVVSVRRLEENTCLMGVFTKEEGKKKSASVSITASQPVSDANGSKQQTIQLLL